ncbi:hypothetical protein [Roseovarius sp.]|uniref:hypothetical protein n=1 Tax=Roseovarius sp. TaxID=1486281 RepID=UPI003BA84A99
MADTPLYALIAHESSDWRAIERHAVGQIEKYQRRLEADLTETETAKLRGRISELRDFLRAARIPDDIGNDEQTEFGSNVPLY